MKLLLLLFLAMCDIVVSMSSTKQAIPGEIKRQGSKKWKYICRTIKDKKGLENKVCVRVDWYKYKDTNGYKTLPICQEQCLGYTRF